MWLFWSTAGSLSRLFVLKTHLWGFRQGQMAPCLNMNRLKMFQSYFCNPVCVFVAQRWCWTFALPPFSPLSTTWTLKTPRTQNEAVCVTNWFQPVVAMVSTVEGTVRGGGGGERWEEKWTCHVMMTLRSRDFFGREVINPQEVMMALSPQERLIHTWINTQTHTKKTARRRDGPRVVICWLYQILMLHRNA